MGNMAYCRFENTLGDLEDCVAFLDGFNNEGDDAPLSDREEKAKRKLIALCRVIADEYGGEV